MSNMKNNKKKEKIVCKSCENLEDKFGNNKPKNISENSKTISKKNSMEEETILLNSNIEDAVVIQKDNDDTSNEHEHSKQPLWKLIVS